MRGPFQHDHYVVPYRRLHCVGYDDCLTQAAKEKWKSWHCEGCDERRVLTAEQEKEQMFGLLEILGTVHEYKDVEELWSPAPGENNPNTEVSSRGRIR